MLKLDLKRNLLRLNLYLINTQILNEYKARLDGLAFLFIVIWNDDIGGQNNFANHSPDKLVCQVNFHDTHL